MPHIIQRMAPSNLIALIEEGQVEGVRVVYKGRWRTFIEVTFDAALDEQWQHETMALLYREHGKWMLPAVGEGSTFGWIYGSEPMRVTLIRLKGDTPHQQSAARRLDHQLERLGIPCMGFRPDRPGR